MNVQQIGKIVNYFRVQHSFHEPYHLLLDGNFIKLLLEKDYDFKRKFENAVKGRASLRVTACIIRELELLGETFKLVTAEAKKYKTINCKHPLEYSVDQCILSQIGDDNQDQYIVCSQDFELRRQLRHYDNVPIVYFAPDQRITMEDINRRTLERIEREAERRAILQEKQAREVELYKREKEEEERRRKIRELSSMQGIQIKTKIARGPNPLSVKRKREKEGEKVVVLAGEAKRKRIRKKKAVGNA